MSQVMTLDELNKWLKGATGIDRINDEVDGSDNRWEDRIYKKEDKFYKLPYINGYPQSRWDNSKGYIPNEYEIEEVFMRKKVIVVDVYETQEEIDQQKRYLNDVDIDDSRRSEIVAYLAKKYSSESSEPK